MTTRPNEPTRALPRATTRALLDALLGARRRYGAEAAATKLRLLVALAGRGCATAAQLLDLQRHLSFLRAFPDDAAVHAAALAGLRTIAARVRALPPRERRRLEDSGTVESVSRHSFDVRIVEWLVDGFPGQARLDWQALEDTRGLEYLLGLTLLRAEEDGFDGAQLTCRRWLALARGRSRATDLEWLVARLRRAPALGPAWRALWSQQELSIAWRLATAEHSITLAALPGVPLEPRHAGLRPAPQHAAREIARPLARVGPLPRVRARQVIELVRATLTVRCREVYAITHANEREVYLVDLGAGTSIAVVGVRPAMRLSLEANYGFLLLANGVPIGYGGVTALFRQANTGINVFDAFRGSEAAALWTQALRAFHSLFGVTRFLINPYQFGAGNSEAIASGAFWFYYRLGFRPSERETRALAAREYARQAGGARSDAATLRKLARDDLELTLPGARARDRIDERVLERLSLLVTARQADAPPATHLAALVARLSGPRRAARSRPGGAAFAGGLACLGPIIALVPELKRWPAAERAKVRALLTAKGSTGEREFAERAQRLPRLFAALVDLARRSAAAKRPRPAS